MAFCPLPILTDSLRGGINVSKALNACIKWISCFQDISPTYLAPTATITRTVHRINPCQSVYESEQPSKMSDCVLLYKNQDSQWFFKASKQLMLNHCSDQCLCPSQHHPQQPIRGWGWLPATADRIHYFLPLPMLSEDDKRFYDALLAVEAAGPEKSCSILLSLCRKIKVNCLGGITAALCC